MCLTINTQSKGRPTKTLHRFARNYVEVMKVGVFKGFPLDSSFRSFWQTGIKAVSPCLSKASSGGQTIKSSIASESKKQETYFRKFFVLLTLYFF
jgi:hypothetical protein